MSSFIVFHMASPCGFQMTMPIPNFFWEKPNNIEKLSLLFREGEKQTLVLKMIHSLFKSLLWHKNAEMSKRGQVSYCLVYKIYKIYWGLSSFFVLFCLIVLYFVLAENHTWRFSGMIMTALNDYSWWAWSSISDAVGCICVGHMQGIWSTFCTPAPSYLAII